jgi:hypothetical protein
MSTVPLFLRWTDARFCSLFSVTPEQTKILEKPQNRKLVRSFFVTVRKHQQVKICGLTLMPGMRKRDEIKEGDAFIHKKELQYLN